MSLIKSKHKFEAFLRVTQSPFHQYYYHYASANDADEAVRLCKEVASEQGWQPPARWQWWRKEDSLEPVVQAISGM